MTDLERGKDRLVPGQIHGRYVLGEMPETAEMCLTDEERKKLVQTDCRWVTALSGKIKKRWKTPQKGVKSRKKRLTQRIAYYIIYNCDVRWKCLGQSPGIGILLYISKQLR